MEEIRGIRRVMEEKPYLSVKIFYVLLFFCSCRLRGMGHNWRKGRLIKEEDKGGTIEKEGC